MQSENMNAGSLHGIRVVDLSRVLGGPYCTQILGDHGADVLKVEPPFGDETRAWGPPFVGEVSSYFNGVNRNKKGVSVDLSVAEGQEYLRELLRDADVLVENFKPGTLEKWGFTVEYLQEHYPQLVHCRVTGFGADGPLGGLPGYDACAQALCGLMSVNGEADGDATRVGLPVVDMVTGLNAAVGILLALQERNQSGRGQFLDITLFDCALSLLHPHAANFFGNGRTPQRSGNAHPNIAPYETIHTQAGDIFLAVGNDRQFTQLTQLLEIPEVANEARFKTNKDRLNNRDALHEVLSQALEGHDANVIAETLLRSGVPAAPVLNVKESLQHPHTQHRQMIYSQGEYQGVASPIKLSRTPATLRYTPPSLASPEVRVSWDEFEND
ncbi:MAG TPA: CoA transferase [Paenalcaligenes sp.]|nr:CoA transferase [Paenalcaligenes sp.]